MKTVADWFKGIERTSRQTPAAPGGGEAGLQWDGEWLRVPPPLADRKVCLLACFSADGKLSRHTLFVAASWRSRQFVVVLIVATDRTASFDVACVDRMGETVDGILVRPNVGYDFGSWAAGLNARPDVRQASLLACANDSLYGPFDGFDEVLSRAHSSAADIVCLTDSYEVQHHMQSYLVFYKPAALRSDAFEQFWATIGRGGREETILQAEVPQLAFMQQRGLVVETLFPTAPSAVVNPTLLHWKNLLERGFPFAKVQLLRDNPWHADIDGWDRLLRERGYDSEIVRQHLGAGFNRSAAAKALTVGYGL